MAYWWEDDPSERYWCEITDRADIGADLHCPQLMQGGKPYWSYSLILEVRPGHTVFHYSTNEMAFIGASIASGPLEERPIRWTAHGTTGRAKRDQSAQEPGEQPGWWLSLNGFRKLDPPLELSTLNEPIEQKRIFDWIKAKQQNGAVMAPFQMYGARGTAPTLRANQGYLTKMPRALVEHWAELAAAVHHVAERPAESRLLSPKAKLAGFNPKSEGDYVAFLKGGPQLRSRPHEPLVRRFGEHLEKRGARVTTPHPIDLMMVEPLRVIFEAKAIRNGAALPAIREAVGQLHEYRYFIGPRDAALCILLDDEPGQALQTYVEEELHLLLAWMTPKGPAMASGTAAVFQAAGIGV